MTDEDIILLLRKVEEDNLRSLASSASNGETDKLLRQVPLAADLRELRTRYTADAKIREAMAKNPDSNGFNFHVERVVMDDTPTETAADTPEAPVQDTTEPDTASEAPKEQDTTIAFPARSEMQAKLARIHNSGIDVPAILSAMGFSRFKDVPKERYGELLGLVEKATKKEKS